MAVIRQPTILAGDGFGLPDDFPCDAPEAEGISDQDGLVFGFIEAGRHRILPACQLPSVQCVPVPGDGVIVFSMEVSKSVPFVVPKSGVKKPARTAGISWQPGTTRPKS